MSTALQEKKEKIDQIINKLIEESAKHSLILVEGVKDVQTLRNLGVSGRILAIKSRGKSLLEVIAEVEKLRPDRVVLLLDFDRRGKEGTKRMKQDLERSKIKIDLRFWSALHALVGREIQCIESLSNYLDTLNDKIG